MPERAWARTFAKCPVNFSKPLDKGTERISVCAYGNSLTIA